VCFSGGISQAKGSMKMLILKNTAIRHGALKVGIILSAILTLGGFMLGATVIYELPVSHETGTWLFVGWMILQTVILRYIELKVTGR